LPESVYQFVPYIKNHHYKILIKLFDHDQ